jgi:transcriptional regulator with PAS, ATPase and Fis domain
MGARTPDKVIGTAEAQVDEYENDEYRRMAEEEVRERASHALSELFDNLYEGAFAVDLKSRITWMNHKFKALIGWNGTDPVEGKPLEEVLPHSQMHRVLETGRADLLDIVPLGNRQLTVSRLPLVDDEGYLVGAMGVILYDRLNSLRPLVDQFQSLQSELDAARKELARTRSAKYSLSSFIGTSEAVRELKRKARRAAARDVPVLILGETGVGKELLAHGIHAASARSMKPMVRLNVSAIPEGLLEAELFGVAPGAYTGAERKGRDGKIRLADGGTLFLDEIGDMPTQLQTKLLRVIQEQELEPLGSNNVIPVDVRIISATSRNLKKMVDEGTFRADLFYRLNVLALNVPPLRDRLEDLPQLCDFVLESMAEREGVAPQSVSAQGIRRLALYHWPGNVREVRNVLEQAVADRDDEILGPDCFEGLLPEAGPVEESTDETAGDQETPEEATEVRPLRETVAEAERRAIVKALEAAGGVRSHAAKLLGISRAQFYEKLGSHDILSDDPDKDESVRISGQPSIR